ncbi:YeiH family protein [Rhodococcus pyridinivorans]|uniref:YeiH family protein n=1 Tax=Rhodococcus pyridinivorans TaxID=103816 RepID=UPI001903A479|nr:putative sulfate exporter family transporter [Rhodococcus pyridinivorans]QQM53995.1 putative sulfate exporter family transporter [Rhodococcus pyridinivorans]
MSGEVEVTSTPQDVVRPEATPVGPRSRAVVLVAGIGVCAAGAAIAIVLGRLFPAVNPMLIAIVLGALVANLVPVPAWIGPGVDFSTKRLLRLGIAVLGLQLVFHDILTLGWGVIALVVVIVAAGITGTMYLGRVLGLSWTQRVLISCGFSICGAAAVAAADGVVDAKRKEVITSIALVVVFGTLMIPGIPLLVGVLGMDDLQSGILAGGSIHEVAQVVAAGGMIGGGTLAVATVVKLARVLMLAPVMAYLGVVRRRRSRETGVHEDTVGRQPPLVPVFVIGFLAAVAVRSSGLLPDVVLEHAALVQSALLTTAMFGLGLGVRVGLLRSIGLRPFVLAASSTLWVVLIALVGVLVLS